MANLFCYLRILIVKTAIIILPTKNARKVLNLQVPLDGLCECAVPRMGKEGRRSVRKLVIL